MVVIVKAKLMLILLAVTDYQDYQDYQNPSIKLDQTALPWMVITIKAKLLLIRSRSTNDDEAKLNAEVINSITQPVPLIYTVNPV